MTLTDTIGLTLSILLELGIVACAAWVLRRPNRG